MRPRSSTSRRATPAARRTIGKEIIGWENIELISDRPFEIWIDEFKQIKDKYPGRRPDRVDHGGVQQGRLGRDRRALPGRRASMRSS